MFKLESYITPLLMGYVDQYVKLRPDDFQLSLWGGDAVLNNLDLRLEVFEKASHLPIVFKSGHVHELRIHVPWTKLGSDPVVITANTVECILKIRDFAHSSDGSSKSSSTRSSQSKPKLKRQSAEELPQGYLQGMMKKITNNVCFVINNLILKFVEDDIVLSVNVKSAECYTVDEEWNRAFTEITPSYLILQKVINFCDLTVCLDKSDASGKIENYQDPMLYRCSITCRLHMMYESVHSSLPKITKLSVHSDRLDVSMTDTQLPMFVRLIELILAIYYGTLKLPSAEEVSSEPSSQQVMRQLSDETSQEDGDRTDEEGQGWMSWAWSFVPQLTDEEQIVEESPLKNYKNSILTIGLYLTKATIHFKLTEAVKKSSYRKPSKIIYKPLVALETEGIGLEALISGETFFNLQIGISYLKLSSQGYCACGVYDENDMRSKVLIEGGKPLAEKLSLMDYQSQSLFDPGGAENLGEYPKFILDLDTHIQTYTETYGQDRFGVFWFDDVYCLIEKEDNPSAGASSQTGKDTEAVFFKEKSYLLFLFSNFHVNVTSSSIHRLQKIIQCAYSGDYEPYGQAEKDLVEKNRKPPTEEQIQSLEEFIPNMSIHVTLLKPSCTVLFAEHPSCKLQKPKQHEKKSTKTIPVRVIHSRTLPAAECSAIRFDFQVTTPMYPVRLVKFASMIAGPSSNILHACHTHTQIKVFGIQIGLQRISPSNSRSNTLVIVTPTSGALYIKSLVMPKYWNNVHLPKVQRLFEIPQIVLSFSKAKLMLTTDLAKSWLDKDSDTEILEENSLLDDVFSLKEHPLLEVSLSGLELKTSDSPAVFAMTGSFSSGSVMLYRNETKESGFIPLMYGPTDTSSWYDHNSIIEKKSEKSQCTECVMFTVQMPTSNMLSEAPAVLLIQVHGVALAVDPAIGQWLAYTPIRRIPEKKEEKSKQISIDFTLAEQSSPLVGDKSQVSLASTSSQSIPAVSKEKIGTHSSPPLSSISEKEVKDKSDDTFGDWLASLFPLVRVLHVQADIQSWVIAFPMTSVSHSNSTPDILQNMTQAFTKNLLPNSLVVCLPSVTILSAGVQKMTVSQEIPLTHFKESIVGEKLPWSVEIKNFSAYTLHRDNRSLSILEPLSLTCAVAVSTKYNPPTSNNISSLGLCLHCEVQTVNIGVSQDQIHLMLTLLNSVNKIGIGCLEMVRFLNILSSHPEEKIQVHYINKPKASSCKISNTSVISPTEGGATLETMETSTDTGPIYQLNLTQDSHTGVILSLWIQCTVPKLEMSLFGLDKIPATKVSMVVEDYMMSIDLQEVYSKIKVLLGTLKVNHFVRKDGHWIDGQHQGLFFSCTDVLPKDVHVVANRKWHSANRDSSPATSENDTPPSDDTHHFLSLTFTSALSKSVRRKMQGMNIELVGLHEQHSAMNSSGWNFDKFISEVCLNMKPCDIIMSLSVIKSVIDTLDFDPVVSKHQAKPSTMPPPSDAVVIPQLNSRTFPLLYVNCNSVRLFVIDDFEESKENEDLQPTDVKTTKDHDVIFAQFSSFLITPHANNPLPRHVVDKDLYLTAQQLGITTQPGSPVEDRQYQIMVADLALHSAVWQDFVDAKRPCTEVATERTTQIPALDWNTFLIPSQKASEEVWVIPIASKFNICITVAPAVIYDNPRFNEKSLVCGHSLELNAMTDMDYYLSFNQLQLLHRIARQVTHLITPKSKIAHEQHTESNTSNEAVYQNTKATACDSGVESTASTTTINLEATSVQLSTIHDDENVDKPHSFVPFDVLLTAGRISVMLYDHKSTPHTGRNRESIHKGDGDVRRMDVDASVTEDSGFEDKLGVEKDLTQSSKSQDGGAFSSSGVCPHLYIFFCQPHTLIQCYKEQQKCETSCYDVSVKGALPDTCIEAVDGKLIPDHTDFTVSWLETRLGKSDPKTGIPPSLYTIQIKDFILEPASVMLKIERPLKVNWSTTKLNQLLQMVKKIQHSLSQSEAEYKEEAAKVPKTKGKKEDKNYEKLLDSFGEMLKKFQFSTEQMVFSFDTSLNGKQKSILASLMKFSVDINLNLNSLGSLDGAFSNLKLCDLLVRSRHNGNVYTLLSPFGLTMDLTLSWGEHTGHSVMPRLFLSMDTSLMELQISPVHLLILKDILEDVTNLSMKLQDSTGEKENADDHHHLQVTEPVRTNFIKWESKNDLQSGGFQYITDPGSTEELPKEGEILFYENSTGGHSSMVWSYEEPRVISQIRVNPVPFRLNDEENDEETELIPKVTCQLQYWDPLLQNFIDCCQFHLSENLSLSLPFPPVKAINRKELIAAQIWRVLISSDDLIPRNRESDDQGPEAMNKPSLVLPTALAASLYVNSCFVPSLIPLFQGYLRIPLVQIRLGNNLHLLQRATPSELFPFHYDKQLASCQEIAVLTLDEIGVVMSHMTGTENISNIQFTSAGSLNITEYKNLTSHRVVSSTELQGSLSYSKENEAPALEIDCYCRPMEMRLGKGIIHTINSSINLWKQILIPKDDLQEFSPLSYYIICNDSQENIRFGQAGTDETLLLHSRQMHCYSWRSHKVSQKLHLCIDETKWRWCEPFCIDKITTEVLTLKNQEKSHTLIVRVKQITNTQNQIIISGLFAISSQLSRPIQFKMVMKNDTILQNVINGEQTLPTYNVEKSDVKWMKFSFADCKPLWSHDFLLPNDNNDNTAKLLKLTETDGRRVQIWIQIFHQMIEGVTQTILLLSPVFVIRSHLPHSLYASVHCSQLKYEQSVEVPGQGSEIEVLCPGGDLKHSLSFDLRSDHTHQDTSANVVTLSTGLIDQVRQSSLKDFDMAGSPKNWKSELDQQWPYIRNSKITDKIWKSRERQEPVSDYSSLDLNVHLSEYITGSNTLLIDVTPWCLVTNECSMDVFWVDENDEIWKISSGQTLVPRKIEGQMKLGVENGSEIFSCNPITLSSEEASVRYSQSANNPVLYIDSSVCVTIVSKNNDCSQVQNLVMKSSFQHRIRILTITNEFNISNLSSLPLDILFFCIPVNSEKLNSMPNYKGPTHKLEKTSTSVSQIPSWHLLSKSSVSTSPQFNTRFAYYLQLAEHMGTHIQSPYPTVSNPVRIQNTEDGKRLNIAIPKPDTESFDTHFLCITTHIKDSIVYVVIHDDPSPVYTFVNQCAFPVQFGQVVPSSSLLGGAIQEELELVDCVPFLPPAGVTHYTPPQKNQTFPTITDKLKPHCIKLCSMQNTGDRTKWSGEVDLTRARELFVNLPDVSDVMIHVEKLSVTSTVTIRPVGKADISAKEIRNKIGVSSVITQSPERELVPAKGSASLNDSSTKLKKKTCTVKKSTALTFGCLAEKITVVLVDESSHADENIELLTVTLDNALLAWFPIEGLSSHSSNSNFTDLYYSYTKSSCNLCVVNLQIDNQLASKGFYDFPVIFMPHSGNKKIESSSLADLSTTEKLAILKHSSVISIQTTLCTNEDTKHQALQSLEIMIKHADVFLEDKLLYRLLPQIQSFVPQLLTESRKTKKSQICLDKNVHSMALSLARPIKLKTFIIHPVQIELCIRASVKLFIALDQTPLSIGIYEREEVCTNAHQLIKSLSVHYATGALFRAGFVIGSLEILGSPTGLVRNIGSGVTDLFQLPMHGITQGPGAFITSITHGVSSLVRHVTTGTVKSITNFASSVSRNMEHLSMDSQHRQRQEEHRKAHPEGLSDGLKQGLTGFGISMLGAVAGLADQPIQYFISAEGDTRTATASRVVTGVGKGMVGVITKPIGGAAELVSQTGQGLLHGTGLIQLPKVRKPAQYISKSMYRNSACKYHQKLFLSLPKAEIIMVVQADCIDLLEARVSVDLVLTPEILFVINLEEDNQQQALHLSDIEFRTDIQEEGHLFITFKDHHTCTNLESKDMNVDRITAYIDSAAPYPTEHDAQSTTQDKPSELKCPPSPSSPVYEFIMDRNTLLLLKAFLKIAQRELIGKGFSV